VHDGGDEQAADHEGVDKDREAESEAELFESLAVDEEE
jgi:hypothetical protein